MYVKEFSITMWGSAFTAACYAPSLPGAFDQTHPHKAFLNAHPIATP
jgi:hypothetical protein